MAREGNFPFRPAASRALAMSELGDHINWGKVVFRPIAPSKADQEILEYRRWWREQLRRAYRGEYMNPRIFGPDPTMDLSALYIHARNKIETRSSNSPETDSSDSTGRHALI